MKKKIIIGLAASMLAAGTVFADGLCTRHDVSYKGSQCPYCKEEDSCYQSTKKLQKSVKKEREASEAFQK